MGGINYPLLSDFWPHGAVTQKYGVLRSEGYSERTIFIIDKQGIIRYIDIHDFDEQPDNEELIRVIRQIDPVVTDRQVKAAPPEKLELPHGGIIMYCTSWCSDCKKARLWLEKNHLEYSEVDVNGTPGAAAQVRKWANGNLVTPVFDIDGKIVVDFDEQKLRETLKDRL
jgi:glutaredoxin